MNIQAEIIIVIICDVNADKETIIKTVIVINTNSNTKFKIRYSSIDTFS